jgi:hypothetical protein
MKKNILLATMVAILTTSAFAQSTPETNKKVAKLEKKEDRITNHQAKNEVKKEHNATQKEEKIIHRHAMKEVKRDKKHSN